MREFYLETRGGRLCVCEWGAAGQPLVVCLHGICDQGAVWTPVADRLAEAGYHVVAPDLRGHGRSARAPTGCLTNLVDLTADVDALLRKLTAPSLILVGHSLGTVIAGMLAAVRRERIKRLVLVEPVLAPRPPDADAVAQLGAQLDFIASQPRQSIIPRLETAALLLKAKNPELSESFSLLLARRATEACEGGIRWRWDPLLRSLHGLSFNGTAEQYLALLRCVGAPVTIVSGDSSNFSDHEDRAKLSAALPRAEHIGLPGGHNVHLASPNLLARCIAESKDAVRAPAESALG